MVISDFFDIQSSSFTSTAVMTLTVRQRGPQDCPLRGVVETCPDILKLAPRLAANHVDFIDILLIC